MPVTEKQKMLAGDLYDPADLEIQADLAANHAWLVRFNASLALPPDQRRLLLTERLAAVGQGVDVRPPFHCDYGFNIALGDRVYLNFNCIILDVCRVSVGDRTLIGPGVQILTADHPRDAAERARGLEFGRPVAIGCDVWIGGGAVVLPGVTIGDGAVVGAGAVVTRDVAAGATVCGSPARPRGPRANDGRTPPA